MGRNARCDVAIVNSCRVAAVGAPASDGAPVTVAGLLLLLLPLLLTLVPSTSRG